MTELPKESLLLPPEKLSLRVDPASFPFQTSAEAQVTGDIVGQSRAVEAITLGLEMEAPGYNVYVSGHSGTGKESTIRSLLNKLKHSRGPLMDICYVYNFRDPDRPKLLTLPPGQGRALRKDMDDFIETLKHQIPLLLEDERFGKEQNKLLNEANRRQQQMIKEFEDKAKEKGFVVEQVQLGPMTRPELLALVNKKSYAVDDLDQLIKEKRLSTRKANNLRAQYMVLRQELDEILRTLHRASRRLERKLHSAERESVRALVEGLVDEIKERYSEAVAGYLILVAEHVLDNLEQFREPEEAEQGQPAHERVPREERFATYRVNLILDRAEMTEPPVVFENSPTYANLFGTIERSSDDGLYGPANFTRIKAGALLRANEGYLVLQAEDALNEMGVWRTLRRTLKNCTLDIQISDSQGAPPSALKPEPISVNVKVLLVGGEDLYQELLATDEDFARTFKIKAEFDTEIDLTDEIRGQYISLMARICSEEGLRHLTREAMARLLEIGAREAEDRRKVTTRFSRMADILREASFLASRDEAPFVTEKHIDGAEANRRRRFGLSESKIREAIADGIVRLDLQGMVVGQVNGLSVLDMGDSCFAQPCRITAITSVGQAGVVSVEREADMSGLVHSKGVLILSGLLRSLLAQDRPLSLTATVCFEQSYGIVDGDSASAAEALTILSSLSGVPLDQGIAITGAVDQRGHLLAVGDATLKVEGFFDACNDRGLTGHQGAIVPKSNLNGLLLRGDVVEAVRQGRFRVYQADTIHEALMVLAHPVTPEEVLRRAGERLEAMDQRLAKSLWGLRGGSPTP